MQEYGKVHNLPADAVSRRVRPLATGGGDGAEETSHSQEGAERRPED